MALYIILFCSILQILYVLNADSPFFKDAFEPLIYKTFVGLSPESCRHKCEQKLRCLTVIYKRQFQLCQLSSELYEHVTYETTSMKRIIILTGVSLNHNNKSSCGDRHCAIEETCEESHGKNTCIITECPDPRIPYSHYGNIYSVGSKLLIKDTRIQKHLTLQCAQDGTWLPNKDTTHDCSDITRDSGVYWQKEVKVPVFCDMDSDGGKWMVFQVRQDGSVDFYRNWVEYTTGFGNISGEFWMGLQAMHVLLSRGSYELRIDMAMFGGERRYAKYSDFTIQGQEEKFKLKVSGFSGDAGNSLSYGNNMAFTTKDDDNDAQDDGNCANWFWGGWWYHGCHTANLNGLYAQDGEQTAHAENLNWYTWLGYNISLQKTSMKFRRKHYKLL